MLSILGVIWSGICSLLPNVFTTAVSGVVTVEQAKIAAVNSTENTQASIVASDNAVRASVTPAMLSHWPTQIPIFCLAMLPAVYGAAVVFDAVTHLHSTDVIRGDVANYMDTIVSDLFGYGAAVVVSMAAKSIFGK